MWGNFGIAILKRGVIVGAAVWTTRVNVIRPELDQRGRQLEFW